MKRKTVQTKYDVPVRRAFRWASEQQSCSAEASMIVRIPAPWLTKEIIFVCTVFLLFTLWMTCERTLIHAHLRCELHHRICNLRYGTHGYEMDAYEGMAKIIDDVKVAVCPECGNIEMYLENLTNLKD